MTLPISNLPAAAQPWGREIQKRMESAEAYIAAEKVNNRARDKSIANSANRLDQTTVAVVNSAQATETQSLTVSVSGADGSKSNQSLASLTFTKPSWANYARVTCTGVVISKTTNQTTSPIVGTMNVSISGTASQDQGGAISSNDISTYSDNQPTTAVQVFSRSFTPGSTFTVDTLVTKAASLAASSYKVQISASVTWLVL
jgi:hypothetical protein